MPARGSIFYLNQILPPGSSTNHRIIVLSPTSLISRQPNTKNNKFFVMVAIIRTQKENMPKVMGHSIDITPNDITGGQAIDTNSVVETHQLFHMSLDSFNRQQPIGQVKKDKLEEILHGARRLFK